ncbi:MAG: T9SS type A sorting domain-containing protein [Bacteroidales bacterium]|nr:T9SS type A sorting domain-containing protein [Bacteroidales bacterium]
MLLIFSVVLNAQSPGFFLDDWEEKNAVIPVHQFIEKPTGNPTVKVAADPEQILHKVPKYIYGNNAVTWDNGMRSNPTAMRDLNNLNPHVLRWPGGNLSNNYFWNAHLGERPDDIPPGTDPWYGMGTQAWQMSVDEYYMLLEETSSTGIICVNYSYARYGTGPDPVANAAHMAAEWVRYDNGRSKFWEIGNENFGNWQAGYEIDQSLNQDGQPRFISGELYGQHCRIFIDSMRTAAAETGADIKIGVVAYDAEESYDPISEVWNEGMMPIVGDIADFLIVHSYFTPYNENSSVGTILNSHIVPGEIYEAVEADMTEAGKTMLPVAMTEWNIFATGSWQQVSYVNGMLAAITLGEFIGNNYGLSTRWDLVNGWDNGDDHGTFSIGGEPGVDPYNPRAVFFYMYYHQLFFGDQMVAYGVTGNENVVAHASTFSSGETGIVITNKSRTDEIVEIDMQNGEYGLNYYYYTLTGGTDNGDFSRQVLINGVETDEEGGGPDNYESIKAHASKTRNGITLHLPSLSVVYVMIDKEPPFSVAYAAVETDKTRISVELTEEILPFSDFSGIDVTVNNTFSPAILNVEMDPDRADKFYIYLDTELNSEDEITLTYSGTAIQSSGGTGLDPFSDMPVDNLIPGGPYAVSVVIIDTERQEPVDNCTITIGGESKATDAEGKVVFDMMEGIYTFHAEKDHYQAGTYQDISIFSDTTIQLEMKPEDYSLSFHFIDDRTFEMLPNVKVSAHDTSTYSNSEGVASISLAFGEYNISFEKVNFRTDSSDFLIIADTIYEILLSRTHAQLKFRLRYEGQPVQNASVVLHTDTLVSNPVGVCVFESVAIEQPFNYKITKENFYPVEGYISLLADSVLELQMTKSVANATFIVSASEGAIENGFVVIDQDTSWCNEEGSAKFYNLPLEYTYTYEAGAPGYEPVNGSFVQHADTTIQLMLTVSVTAGDAQNGIMIYPNPVIDHLIISYGDHRVDQLQVLDITGNSIFVKIINDQSGLYNLPIDVNPGIYFLRINSGGHIQTRKIIVK